jgi:methylated-DNA-protein-cysteine methyltransferase-like protein
MTDSAKGWNKVYKAVNAIPSGSVATYGQIAALAGMPGAARQVGWALSALDAEDDVPWHRVINAQGQISPRGARESVDLQRALLESEGIELSHRGRVDLGLYAWQPGARKKKRGTSK